MKSMEIFLKRAERAFFAKIGEDKTKDHFSAIKKALNEIPDHIGRDMGSEIPKFIFKITLSLDDYSSDIVEKILEHILIFSQVLLELIDNSRTEIHKRILRQSQNQCRSLLDLMKKFIEKAEEGENFENNPTFENVLHYISGKRTEIIQFKDTELFIKRSEQYFSEIIGQEKAQKYSLNIIESLEKIDKEFQEYMASEIAKYLFKFSQTIQDLSAQKIEALVDRVIIFINAISDLGGNTIAKINQDIIKRSNKKLRSLFDLFKDFIEDNLKNNENMGNRCTLDEIIDHTCGDKKEITQFSDIGGFLKRTENLYASKIGKEKIHVFIEEILEQITKIPENHRKYIGSDITKSLLKYSENISNLSAEEIEQTFTNTISFLKALSDLDYLSQEEVNMHILVRSNQTCRNLIDLYHSFQQHSKKRLRLHLQLFLCQRACAQENGKPVHNTYHKARPGPCLASGP